MPKPKEPRTPDPFEALRAEIADLAHEMRQQHELLSIVCGQVNALLRGGAAQAEASARMYEGFKGIAEGLAAMIERQAAMSALLVAAAGVPVH